MINTSELRVGNEVFYLDNVWCTVVEVGLYWDKVGLAGIGSKVKIADIKPIPLTPEILEKCGFEKGSYHEDHFYHPKLTPHIVMFTDGFKMEVVDDIHVADYFHYVHQLQNLFWCLSGSELEIKF